MKNIFTLSFLFSFLFYSFSFSQGTWIQKANFGGVPRALSFGFSIGSKGYIGGGTDYSSFISYNDFWEWDQATNVWTQKANYPGLGSAFPFTFSIGNKGYVGTGADKNYISQKDFWEYDPAINTWTQKSNFAGVARSQAVSFRIGNKGYIGTGLGSPCLKDFWEYDPLTDTWIQKSNFAGGLREAATGFSIGKKGYIGSGGDLINDYTDLWEWDQATDTWTQKANFPGKKREGAAGFSIGQYGYIGIGDTVPQSTYSLSDFWQYNPSTNTWTQMPNYGGGKREYAAAFLIGCKAYVGTGSENLYSSVFYKNDFWEFTPPSLNSSLTGITNVDCFGSNSGGATINIIDGTSPYTYLWSIVPSQTSQSVSGLYAGTYLITVIDSVGCSASDTLVISSPTLLTSLPPATSQTKCFGDSTGTATITAAGGNPSYTYIWNPTGQTSAATSGLSAGVYTVTITDNSGCIINTLVQIMQPMAITASISSDTSICSGTNATDSVTVSGGTPGYTYLWMSGGATTQSIMVSPPGTTTYTAQVTDANGCSAQQLITTVTVVQYPAASLSYTPDSCGGAVQFADNSTNAVTWNWDFGDGNTSAVQQPSHLYAVPGLYSVILTLSNQLGCQTSDTLAVDVPVSPRLIYIPNAFSPNNDKENDMLYVYGKCIAEMKLVIYSNWGEKVFETDNQTEGWNGIISGKTGNSSVFVYFLQATLSSGETVNKKGNISLIR